ncbi:MAG: ankyrin repeat domain-containing protein [Novosphingobium sp.]|nr:ankyrin repeat domain-containing protein [Novosphingobium sp.]
MDLAKLRIFISSSGDLAELREGIDAELMVWLRENQLEDVLWPYRWEKDTGKGDLLNDREPVQPQLFDPASDLAPFTICMFGERCGVPLSDKLPDEWKERVEAFREPGQFQNTLVHPWPDDPDKQSAFLTLGCFPLTGTVFELLSALANEGANLITGYVADRDVDAFSNPASITFNDSALFRMQGAPATDSEAGAAYLNQKKALFNFLTYLRSRQVDVRRYESMSEMREAILRRTIAQLRQDMGFGSPKNPFKRTLEHWAIDEPKDLPGRNSKVKSIVDTITGGRGKTDARFVVLEGPSGCGKSSVLQRGVLRRMADNGDKVVVFRPTDLTAGGFDSEQLEALWVRVCTELEDCKCVDIDASPPRSKARKMAERLGGCLDQTRNNLVLGLDQFEEMLDELKLAESERERPKGWWQVLQFLRAMLPHPRFSLVATLENRRRATFEDLRIESYLKARKSTFDLSVLQDDFAAIATSGFSRGGLTLHPDLVQEIKDKWTEFRRQQPGGEDAPSPLPLGALWLADLYERFEDRAVEATGQGAQSDFSVANRSDADVIRTEDLPDGVEFDGLIARLCDEAWDKGAPGKRIKDNSTAGPPDPTWLDNFLTPLVGIDREGNIRLPAMPENRSLTTYDEITAAFVQSRLLVPAGQIVTGEIREALVRLVHQAVIDQWPPARKWYARKKAHIEKVEGLRERARIWARDLFQHQEIEQQATPARIELAARVLHEYRSVWPGKKDSELISDDALLRNYLLAIFQNAKDGMEIVQNAGVGKRFIHVAASYHCIALIKKFVQANKACLNAEMEDGSTPLKAAAWTDGDAVQLLLELGAAPFTQDGKWHPITGAIQKGAQRNYEALIDRYRQDLETSVGPDGVTMIFEAAWCSDTHCLYDLLVRGADPNAKSDSGWRPIHFSALKNRSAHFEVLLQHVPLSTTQEASKANALHLASSKGAVDIVRSALKSRDVSENDLHRALLARDNDGKTPIMLAAYLGQVEIVRLLLDLEVCHPSDPNHLAENGDTLLHLAVRDGSTSDELRVRVRRMVELLLKDGRLDPNQKNHEGHTAFDIAHNYPEARRAIRNDRRIPKDHENMSPAMWAEDLGSPSADLVTQLVASAPDILARELPGKSGMQAGMDIILDAGRDNVVAALLSADFLDDDMWLAHRARLVALAADPKHAATRTALVDRVLEAGNAQFEGLPVVLDACFRTDQRDLATRLFKSGVREVRGSGPLAMSEFHELAVRGDIAAIRDMAELGRLAVPLDDWGRRPSDVCSAGNRLRLRATEEELFDPPRSQQAPLQPAPTFFHELAWRARENDIRIFENLARAYEWPVPIDGEGRKPSEIAPKAVRERLAEIERQNFAKEN